MNRMWEIREHDSDREREGRYGHRMGKRDVDHEVEKAYECGYEDGYEAALKEMKHSYGERRGRY